MKKLLMINKSNQEKEESKSSPSHLKEPKGVDPLKKSSSLTSTKSSGSVVPKIIVYPNRSNTRKTLREAVAGQSSLKPKPYSSKLPKPDAEMFIIRALEKILLERDIKTTANSQIRRTCEEALGMS